jgi:hypothetical protein
LTLGVRVVVNETIGIAGGAGADIFSCTVSSSFDDDESLDSDENHEIVLSMHKSCYLK